ncbi:MAG: copper resistance protein CopC [Pseudomonadales bacterium]|nr:copper resistance protein CopC [Pseudomonadales bacterium]
MLAGAWKSAIIIIIGVLASCVSSPEESPLIRAEPDVGSVLTRAPRTLRLYYTALPDVSQSSLRLIGPDGDLALRGLHTMAADDLMIEILDTVTPGSYTVVWETVVEGSPAQHEGSYQFSYVPESSR